MRVPFNRPYLTGRELDYIREAHESGQLSGNGPFTKRCQEWLKSHTGAHQVLLTHSCTGALEMAALLLDLSPGDEIIMPSYTFVSTANAFVLRGAVPVFVDIRPDTLNLDEKAVAAAVTARTRAVVPVHYAGVGCKMDEILAIARDQGLAVIEDAAQGCGATWKGKALGSIGDLGTLSFHETKNVTSGEGGALLINNPRFAERAEILWEKGTDRSRYHRGEVDKYTWVDMGSSFLPGEVVAAFLWAQLEKEREITARRLAIWNTYHEAFKDLEERCIVRRPVVPEDCSHNAHMYYLLLQDLETRSRLISRLKEQGIHAVFHFVPLHDSPAGRKFGRAMGEHPVTKSVSERLVRLPLWLGVEEYQPSIIETIRRELE